jgi:hypothetical protein
LLGFGGGCQNSRISVWRVFKNRIFNFSEELEKSATGTSS